MTRLKVKSNGSPTDTYIYVVDDDGVETPIDNVQRISLRIDLDKVELEFRVLAPIVDFSIEEPRVNKPRVDPPDASNVYDQRAIADRAQAKVYTTSGWDPQGV